jgi:hypothetical protein
MWMNSFAERVECPIVMTITVLVMRTLSCQTPIVVRFQELGK